MTAIKPTLLDSYSQKTCASPDTQNKSIYQSAFWPVSGICKALSVHFSACELAL
jgi:hypothetical protein